MAGLFSVHSGERMRKRIAVTAASDQRMSTSSVVFNCLTGFVGVLH